MNLGEILAGGQERRKKLDQTLGETLNYYLGPTGIPQRLAALGVLNPVNDMEQASQKAKTVFAPDATGRERFDAGVGMVTDMATVLAPVAATNRVGGDATAAVVDSLLGFGSTTREGLQDAGRRFAGDESGAIRAFHGSPHDFDKFSMDKIGTGEGAQDLGRGLYFYDEELPASMYKNPAARWGDIGAMQRYSEMGPGRVYEVNINAQPEQILDVKTPASALPEGSRMAARRDARIARETDPEFQETMRQHLLVQHIMDNAEQDMLADGFAGFKRKKFDGETEMVILDENLIEIVQKYGVAGAAAMLGMSAADVQAATGGQQSLGTLMANYDQDAEQRKLRDYLQQ